MAMGALMSYRQKQKDRGYGVSLYTLFLYIEPIQANPFTTENFFFALHPRR